MSRAHFQSVAVETVYPIPLLKLGPEVHFPIILQASEIVADLNTATTSPDLRKLPRDTLKNAYTPYQTVDMWRTYRLSLHLPLSIRSWRLSLSF